MAAVCIYDGIRPAHLLLNCEMGGSMPEVYSSLDVVDLAWIVEAGRQEANSNVEDCPGWCVQCYLCTFRALGIIISAQSPEVQSRYILPFHCDMTSKFAVQHRTLHRQLQKQHRESSQYIRCIVGSGDGW
jgi:hypothetical protein